ncbi:MAG: radical SAM protein [Candidatus Kerfeldbacteria bacterium]|nr:radical SAM protein [Candidatus Kerfeldbacteria bacterium]
MRTRRPHISNLRRMPLTVLCEEAFSARPNLTCPEMVSVSTYSTGPRCKGDCRFCGWNRNVIPQPQERRELAPDILTERVNYAASVNGVLECMDNAIAASPAVFERCEQVARACGAVRWGVNPGICKSRTFLVRFREMGAAFYANNIETSPRLFRSIITSHTQEAKLKSLARAREEGLPIATGVIVGMPGESDEDYDAMAEMLRALVPDVLRVNFFFPIAGLALAERFSLPPAEHVLRIVCFFRILFPETPLYLGAGRSIWLRNMQREAEAFANGVYCEQRFLNHGGVDTVE